MKKLVNESISDMLRGKSWEEIERTLNVRPNATFKRSEKWPDGGYVTSVNASYKKLVSLFGKPTPGDRYKVSTEWVLENDLGQVVSLYDWKSTKLYHDDLPSVKRFRSLPSYDWHIVGNPSAAYELMIYILKAGNVNESLNMEKSRINIVNKFRKKYNDALDVLAYLSSMGELTEGHPDYSGFVVVFPEHFGDGVFENFIELHDKYFINELINNLGLVVVIDTDDIVKDGIEIYDKKYFENMRARFY